jgi:hypothetical protein
MSHCIHFTTIKKFSIKEILKIYIPYIFIGCQVLFPGFWWGPVPWTLRQSCLPDSDFGHPKVRRACASPSRLWSEPGGNSEHKEVAAYPLPGTYQSCLSRLFHSALLGAGWFYGPQSLPTQEGFLPFQVSTWNLALKVCASSQPPGMDLWAAA